MRRLMTILLLASMLVLSFPSTYAQRKTDKPKKAAPSVATQRGTDTISARQLQDYLMFIASDEMEGRDTPSRGLDTTAKFIATNLARWGFKPAGDNGTFFQKIELRRDRADGGQTKVEFFGRALNSGVEYIPLAGSGIINAPMVFAGNGWFIKSKNIDAYKDIDPTGKIAIIYGSPTGFPRGIGRGDLTGKMGEDWMGPTDYARKKGVVALVFVPDLQFLTGWERTRRLIMDRGSLGVAKFQPQGADPLPSIVVSPELANGIFVREKSTANQLYNGYYGTGLPAPFALNPEKKLSMNLANRSEIIPTQNVVAVWEGSDPVLKDEYVAIGAHYDHVGTSCPPLAGDQICNGADDDGSGTTAMLGIAEALAQAPARPKRSILFVWHCGEEKGLWGSRYFTEYPTIPINQIVTQLNMDMIGRSKKEGDTNSRNRNLTGPNDIYVIGSTMMSTELGEILETVNKSYLNLGFDKKYDDPADPERFFYRSDHYNYAKKGIPIIFFFDGVHEDYHGAGDSADKIDYQKMEKVVRTVYMTMWEVATRPTRPKVDKPLPAQLSTN